MNYNLVKCKCIDGDLVFTSIILESTSQETMCKEELIDPEDFRNSLVKPSLEELESYLYILDVTSKWSERIETRFDPHSWNLTVKHR